MGDDAVIECINESGNVKAYASYTIVQSGKYDSSRNLVRKKLMI